MFVSLSESFYDKWHPVVFGDFVEKDNLSKSIEWIIGIIEDVHHHVAFAAIHAVCS